MIRGPRSLAILALAIGLTTATPAVARIRLGAEAGVISSTFSYDETPWTWEQGAQALGRQYRWSFTGGGLAEITLGERFAVTAGLRYVQQGTEFRYDLGAPSSSVEKTSVGELRLNYLSVPALIELHSRARHGLFVSLGPDVAFLLSASAIYDEETTGGGVRTNYQDIFGILEGTNVSIDAGVGYEFPLENHSGVVQVRYSHGLSGVAARDHWISDWYTRAIECVAGLRW
jgi:outer membrane protein with beta-barrel domain